jgi:hypothetical protein
MAILHVMSLIGSTTISSVGARFMLSLLKRPGASRGVSRFQLLRDET